MPVDFDELVQKGMSILSVDQFSMIDLAMLDMEDPSNCILGQCFGNYSRGLVELFGEENQVEAVVHGFNGPLVYFSMEKSMKESMEESRRSYMQALQAAWVKALENKGY